jgi:hypothetical protein
VFEIEKYFSTIIVDWIMNPYRRDVYHVAGIDPRHFPTEFTASRMFADFQRIADNDGEPLARHELRTDIEATESMFADYSSIPADPEALIKKHSNMRRAYQSFKISEKLKQEPHRLAEIIDSVEIEDSKAVKVFRLEDIAPTVIREHIAKPVEKRLVKIDGFPKLSNLVGGFNPQRIGFLMGETGFGKTNLLVNLALRARHTMKTIFVNMEMAMGDVIKRAAVNLTGMTHSEYDHQPELLEPYGFVEKVFQFRDRLFITDGTPLSVNQIKAVTRAHSKGERVEFLIIDYDQKLELAITKSEPEWFAMKRAVQSLEQFAMDEKLHILLAVQVNREGQVSSSHRSTFGAHYILNFYNHNSFGPCIESTKNRHATNDSLLKVNYDKSSSRITELDLISKSEHDSLTKGFDLPNVPKRRVTAKGAHT